MTITQLGRKSLALGLNTSTTGNLSTRVDATHFLIKPHGITYEALRDEDLVVCDLEGNAVGGIPSSEWRMHAVIYKYFPQINAVVHTHSPNASVYAESEQAFEEIPCTTFSGYGTWAVGESLLPYLPEHTQILLGKHGTVAVGATLEEAFDRAVEMENRFPVRSRSDHDLPFMLRYENIAWYQEGSVSILDRRVYPWKIRFEECRTYQEVVRALQEMVTQSGGPFTAVGMGLALAAVQGDGTFEYLEKAARELSNARPTTSGRMQQITDSCLNAVRPLIGTVTKDELALAIRDHVIALNNQRYDRMSAAAGYLCTVIPEHATIITQCFGETCLGMLLRELKKLKREVRFFCPETRPFLQGARLTATVCQEMGFDTTVITDNMPAFVMKHEGVDLFTCAADCITLDGHVVNKVGTSQIALCAREYGVPMYVTGTPDRNHPTMDTVHLEMRDPTESIHIFGHPTTAPGVRGYYPAFDITEPHFVKGIVTEAGIFDPNDLRSYLKCTDSEISI